MHEAAGHIDAAETALATVVRLSGEIDVALRDEASTALARAVTAGKPVVLDACSIRFIDSSGIAFLIQCTRACRQVGLPVTLQDPPVEVVDLLTTLGLEEMLLTPHAVP